MESILSSILPAWLLEKTSTISQTQLIFSLGTLAVLLIQIFGQAKKARNSVKGRYLESPGFPTIEPLETFDWKTTEPIKLRPFKPKYHLTMALENVDPSELIPMDKTYQDRLGYRRSILQKHRDTVIAVADESDPRIRAAVGELYKFLMATYLPLRYPQMFRLHQTAFETGMAYMLENLVMNELYPAELTKYTPTTRALATLFKNIDEDFLILLPDESTGSDEQKEKKPTDDSDEAEITKYKLVAYETCYPAGFNPREKLGKRLAQIHGPVPGYESKLEKSMDRFFDKVEVGKYVRRANWSISTGDTELFAAFGGLHSTGNDSEKLSKIKPGDLDIDTTVLRCERQTLHRLPKSKALVFGFHTYTYPLKEIKEEGLGEELATAIEGLKDGNTPEMHIYKRGFVWGDAVTTYLRS